jgi:hypothetical protein
MLNIISRSIYDEEIRGPKKVVENLIKGLEKIKYPYVINKDLNSCRKLWIQDDIGALKKVKDLDENIKVIIGPNLFVFPDQIPSNLDISKAVYIQPSLWVQKLWEKLGFKKCAIDYWPVGIDTKIHQPQNERKNIVLVYLKGRDKKDLEFVKNILKNKNISYKMIIYGSYKHEEYIKILKNTKYIVLIDKTESQGIAFEEAMSMDIPLLVWNHKKVDFIENKINNSDIDVTSVPYFDNRCGLIIESENELPNAIDKIEKEWKNGFSPRSYILENLTLEKQAREFIKLYEKHYGLPYEAGFLEKKLNNKKWKNAKWYYLAYFYFKDIMKRICK